MTSELVLLAVCIVLSLCVIALTVSLVLTSQTLRRTLQKADRSLDEIETLLGRANRISGAVEGVAHRAALAVSGLVDRLHGFGLGNGTRAEPRPRHRR